MEKARIRMLVCAVAEKVRVSARDLLPGEAWGERPWECGCVRLFAQLAPASGSCFDPRLQKFCHESRIA
jgi:hypothetical protein